VFRRTNAHCTDTTNGRCPGGDWFREGANGNTDAKLCDGVPVFQRVGQGGGVDGSGPVLYRFYNVDSGETVWRVGPSARLADCYYASTDYLHSNHGATAGAPTAPGYSAGKGWYDHETNGARGTISVAAVRASVFAVVGYITTEQDAWLQSQPAIGSEGWSVCYNSATDDASSPSAFHAQCDQFSETVSIARNQISDCADDATCTLGEHIFGGYVR
jgi:hypothetical protein